MRDPNSQTLILWLNASYTRRKKKWITITLTPAQLKIFEGKYQLQQNKGLFVQITAADDHLFVKQLWDGNELLFVPESELGFFAKDNPLFPIRFIRDKEGTVTQIIAFERDLLDKVKE